jgi:phosphotransferase system  glucose/maltose/N-acetylglucosamine-specific IIC component
MSDYNKPDYKVSTVCGLIGMILNIVYCMLVLSIVGVLAQFDTQHTATFLIVYLICLFIFLLLFYTGTYAIYAAYANKENRPI